MTPEEQIDQEFQEAYRKACKTNQKFPPDIMLRFYAYYKKASEEQDGVYTPSRKNDVRNAFKINALLQVKDMTVTEAKKAYIELVREYVE